MRGLVELLAALAGLLVAYNQVATQAETTDATTEALVTMATEYGKALERCEGR